MVFDFFGSVFSFNSVWIGFEHPETPQQNGVAKQTNKTLLECARCMRINAALPKSFRAEAVNTAAYLINRYPSTAIDLKIP